MLRFLRYLCLIQSVACHAIAIVFLINETWLAALAMFVASGSWFGFLNYIESRLEKQKHNKKKKD